MRFKDINIGDKAEIVHTITQEDIEKFVNLSGDDNKLHIDAEYAAKTHLKKPVAHGMIGASFISTLIGTKIPGDGALWLAQNFEFLRPVRVGDKITIKVEVVKKIERDSLIELTTEITNQNKELCTTGTAKVKVIEQVEETAKENAETFTHQNSYVLVVGGTGGIGSEIAVQLAKKGYNILLHYNQNQDSALKLADKIKNIGKTCVTIKADVTNEDDVKNLLSSVKRYSGKLAGFAFCPTPHLTTHSLLELGWEDFQKQIDVNAKGFFLLAKALCPIMIEQKYGKIVILTTQWVDKPVPKWSDYIGAKSCLYGMAKSASLELAPFGVRVNFLAPGVTDTNLIANMPLKSRMLLEASIPLKRLATPDDVSKAAVYLFSEDSDYLVGETIRINGGQHIL